MVHIVERILDFNDSIFNSSIYSMENSLVLCFVSTLSFFIFIQFNGSLYIVDTNPKFLNWTFSRWLSYFSFRREQYWLIRGEVHGTLFCLCFIVILCSLVVHTMMKVLSKPMLIDLFHCYSWDLSFQRNSN